MGKDKKFTCSKTNVLMGVMGCAVPPWMVYACTDSGGLQFLSVSIMSLWVALSVQARGGAYGHARLDHTLTCRLSCTRAMMDVVGRSILKRRMT